MVDLNSSLLAKARPKSGVIPPEITLKGHTDCVLAAVDALFGKTSEPTRLGRSWLRFFGLPEAKFDRFRRHLRIAAAAHDWGKANDGFAAMLDRTGEQAVRHEHLSGLLLADLFADPAISAWLIEAGVDTSIVLAAVLGHHVKAGMMRNEYPIGAMSLEALRFHSDHPDFLAIWRLIQDEVGGDAPGPFKFPGRMKKSEIESKRVALHASLGHQKSRLRDDREATRWVAAVRAGLIAADSVGSAVVRIDDGEGGDAIAQIGRWVGDCFESTLTADEVWREVIERRIDNLRKNRRWDDSTGSSFRDIQGFKPFQADVATKGPRVLMTASCGSGKTLAAWNWITSQLEEQPGTTSRVLFLYPTRATATEGFRDYVSWAPEDDAGLLSGTAAYELRDMFTVPDEATDPRRGLTYQSDARLFSLGHWKKRIFSATADQFFPFMQYAYGPLCLLPLLVESIVVVDEVHSFDSSMFSTLKRFLREFPEVPVLCMTATLPRERRKELVGPGGCGLVEYPESTSSPEVEATQDRYHVEWIDREGAKSLVRGELLNRRRVLWVSNRVVECQATFKCFSDLGGDSTDPSSIPLFCYHSRFKLKHRMERHKELIAAFQEAAHDESKRQGILGSTTQVCEMSLDLDAEILVTDLAPIASLIQRMGRSNRDSSKLGSRPIGRVYVLRSQDGQEKPYEKFDLDAAKRFVNEITGRPISQDELEQAYRRFDPSAIEPDRLCPFLDSGPYAVGKEESFREIDEFTVPCILDDDLDRYVAEILKAHNPSERIIDGYIVPVPRRFANEPKPEASWFPRWLSVASMLAYDPILGFDETKLTPTKRGSDA
jgi:CRISPR-associated endonuclease/helicase Cas3